MTALSTFEEPDWEASLDIGDTLDAIPEDATISGMFSQPVVMAAKKKGVTLRAARERYLPFQFYPQREHVALMLEACSALYPERPLRWALRSLGRGAPEALAASTLGKILFASASGVGDVIAAMAKTYPINLRQSQARVIEVAGQRCVVRLENVYYFIDSHHVGIFEGTLRYAGSKGRVLYHELGPHAGELLIEWTDER